MLALALLLPGSSHLARADERTNFLIDRLKYPPGPGQADDPRVRGQAALQLGKTNDDVALRPLCEALGDPSDFVRVAAASGLKRLARAGGLPCLKGRLAVESNANVKTQLQQSIDALGAAGGGGGGGGGEPAAVANAKFYVSLSTITNNTGRPQAEIDAIVVAAIRAKLTSLGTYQVAPARETPDAARAAMSSRKLKGYYLSILVDRFDYSDGNLRVKVRVSVFSYPGKALRGEVPISLVQSSVSPGDKAAEDNLMGIASGAAIDQFSQAFQ